AEQDVGFEEVASTNLVEWEMSCDVAMDRCISVGWIKQIPITGGEFGHERQGGIAKEACTRHCTDTFEVKKAISFCIIGFARNDGHYKLSDQARIHLAVPIYLDDDVHPVRDGGLIARHHRATNALVYTVSQHAKAWVS